MAKIQSGDTTFNVVESAKDAVDRLRGDDIIVFEVSPRDYVLVKQSTLTTLRVFDPAAPSVVSM